MLFHRRGLRFDSSIFAYSFLTMHSRLASHLSLSWFHNERSKREASGAGTWEIPENLPNPLFHRTNVHELLDSDELAGLKEYLARVKDTIYGDKFFDEEASA